MNSHNDFHFKKLGSDEYVGHLVTGKRAAVAVEAEECSNTGIESKKRTLHPFNWIHLKKKFSNLSLMF